MAFSAETVIDAVSNGDTAQQVAQRLGCTQGTTGRVHCCDVLPVLNQARDEGLLTRRVDRDDAVARWSRA